MLLRSALLAWQGDQMGLTASDAEIRDYLRDSGLADGDGQLDRERITQYAESEFGTVRHFQERLRADLLAEKTARLIWESAAVSDAEARDAVRYQLEEVKIAAVKLDGRSTPRGPRVVPDEAGQALLAKDPERVRKSYEERKSELRSRRSRRACGTSSRRFEPRRRRVEAGRARAHRRDPEADRGRRGLRRRREGDERGPRHARPAAATSASSRAAPW